jgi:hypothetical protein
MNVDVRWAGKGDRDKRGSRQVATAAATARDATHLKPPVCFFILFIFYYTNIFFRFTYHVETAMAATTTAAAAAAA